MTIDFEKSCYMKDTVIRHRLSKKSVATIEIISTVSENLLSLLFVNTYIGIGR